MHRTCVQREWLQTQREAPDGDPAQCIESDVHTFCGFARSRHKHENVSRHLRAVDAQYNLHCALQVVAHGALQPTLETLPPTARAATAPMHAVHAVATAREPRRSWTAGALCGHSMHSMHCRSLLQLRRMCASVRSAAEARCMHAKPSLRVRMHVAAARLQGGGSLRSTAKGAARAHCEEVLLHRVAAALYREDCRAARRKRGASSPRGLCACSGPGSKRLVRAGEEDRELLHIERCA
jgi:hypothetical protein